MSSWNPSKRPSDDSGIEPFEVGELLLSLTEKSLVVTDGDGRWRLFETVRDYGRTSLADGGDAEAIRDRHFAHYASLAEEADPHLNGAEQQNWIQKLAADHDNIRAALEWSQSQYPSACLKLAVSVWRMWLVRGFFGEGRAYLTNSMAASGADRRTTDRGRAANGAGVLAGVQGDYSIASLLFEEAQAIGRETGDWKCLATALNNLGSIDMEQGHFASAQVLYEECLSILRAADDQRGIAMALGNLGIIAKEKGELIFARDQIVECLAIFRSLGDRSSIATSLNNLGSLDSDLGDSRSARALQLESLGIARELGDRWGISIALASLGLISHRTSDYAEARRLFQECLAILRELGDRRTIAMTLEGLAETESALTHVIAAAKMWGASERLREEIGAPMPPSERSLCEEQIAAARAALHDDPVFDAAWAEGRAMTMEQVIAMVLSN